MTDGVGCSEQKTAGYCSDINYQEEWAFFLSSYLHQELKHSFAEMVRGGVSYEVHQVGPHNRAPVYGDERLNTHSRQFPENVCNQLVNRNTPPTSHGRAHNTKIYSFMQVHPFWIQSNNTAPHNFNYEPWLGVYFTPDRILLIVTSLS